MWRSQCLLLVLFTPPKLFESWHSRHFGMASEMHELGLYIYKCWFLYCTCNIGIHVYNVYIYMIIYVYVYVWVSATRRKYFGAHQSQYTATKVKQKTNNAASVWSYLKGSLIWHVTQSVSVTSLVYAIVASNRAPELFEWHSPHYGTTSHRHHQVKH